MNTKNIRLIDWGELKMDNIDNVRLIELECTSECNRQCKFCPNSYIDRHSTNKEMTDEIFTKLIDELVKINYTQYITFSRYNEPFMHPKILRKRVDYIKEKLPDVTLISNTNGDWDNKPFREDIEITEMCYDHNKVCFISRDLRYRVMRLEEINNRAGTLDQSIDLKRTTPCLEPTYFIGIDYTGDVVPCCNIRGDIDKHKPYVLGNLKDKTLVEIFNSKKAMDFRRNVKKSIFPEICKYCTKKEGRYTRDDPSIM